MTEVEHHITTFYTLRCKLLYLALCLSLLLKLYTNYVETSPCYSKFENDKSERGEKQIIKKEPKKVQKQENILRPNI